MTGSNDERSLDPGASEYARSFIAENFSALSLVTSILRIVEDNIVFFKSFKGDTFQPKVNL